MKLSAIIVAVLAASCGGDFCLAQNAPAGAPPATASPMQEPPAQSAPPQAPADGGATTMIGAWEFSNADHDKICHFNFRADAVTAGSKLDIDKNCPNLFPSTGTIVGWSLDKYGSLRLLDAQGNAVIEMSEVESGMYDGFTPEEGRYILQTAAAAPLRSADDLVGDWGVVRGTGKPICTLTLSNTAAGGGGDLALKVKPGCDASVTRFNPTAWRMDQGELVVLSQRGQSWQFEENDTNTWQRVPESADPLLLVRQ